MCLGDPTRPVISLKFRRNPYHFSQVDVYLKPFKWHVWVAIAASIPVGALAAYMVERKSPDKSNNRSNRFNTFTNNLFYSYGAFLNERK